MCSLLIIAHFDHLSHHTFLFSLPSTPPLNSPPKECTVVPCWAQCLVLCLFVSPCVVPKTTKQQQQNTLLFSFLSAASIPVLPALTPFFLWHACLPPHVLLPFLLVKSTTFFYFANFLCSPFCGITLLSLLSPLFPSLSAYVCLFLSCNSLGYSQQNERCCATGFFSLSFVLWLRHKQFYNSFAAILLPPLSIFVFCFCLSFFFVSFSSFSFKLKTTIQ